MPLSSVTLNQISSLSGPVSGVFLFLKWFKSLGLLLIVNECFDCRDLAALALQLSFLGFPFYQPLGCRISKALLCSNIKPLSLMDAHYKVDEVEFQENDTFVIHSPED